MRGFIISLALACAVVAKTPTATTTYPPMDHGGGDLIAVNGSVIWGVHTNVGLFQVPQGVSVRVAPYNGSDTQRGMVEVFARTIDIGGEIDASGAGYTGGGGGGGSGGVSSQGGGGGAAYSGFGGGPGTEGRGGSGHAGAGPFGGSAATGGASTSRINTDAGNGDSGGPGGYAAAHANGDTSEDDSTRMGSGGAGGGGGGAQYGPLVIDDGGGGGGGGGSGGGMIRLHASDEMYFRHTGRLISQGAIGANGASSTNSNGAAGGTGGNTSGLALPGTGINEGGDGGLGAGGAGGGILIDVASARTIVFEPYATVGNTGRGNGGLIGADATTKVFHRGNDPTATLPFIFSGRTFVRNLATDHPPQDHGGADLVLGEGDRIWGLHTGIRHFEVPAGVRALVRPFDGSDGATGRVEVVAEEIVIDGTLDATGAGFTGGGGGGGSGGDSGGPGLGGHGAYPGFDGQQGAGGGGNGHAGAGSASGIGASGGTTQSVAGGTGADGGYAVAGGNGDLTTDSSTQRGSGGGGGGGAGVEPMGSTSIGGGGGAGGSGGGEIRLVPTRFLRIGSIGRLLANGLLGGNGRLGGSVPGPDGGWVAVHETGTGGTGTGGGGNGGDGGSGAGGGVFIDLSLGAAADLAPSAVIESLGGRGETTNGGTVKVFHFGAAPALPQISAGRVFTHDLGPLTGIMVE
jgi:hypothetical protein